MHNSLREKVLQALDIVSVVGEYVSLSRRGKEYVGLCPFHPDHRPSLYVSPAKQIFKCFACGAGGDAIKFVQLRERTDYGTALSTLAQRAGIELRGSATAPASASARQQLLGVLAWAQNHFQRNLHQTPAGKSALNYALARGLSEKTIERFGLGYAADAWDDLLNAARRVGLSTQVLKDAGLVAVNEAGKVYDRFRHRLIFPICDPQGRCVGFGGRTLGDDPAKYLNSPETVLFSKSRLLYALGPARAELQQRREVIIVEGYLDALLLHQCGFPHAVATLGTALSDAHVKLLRPLVDRIVLCFDGDQAGLRAADRAVEVALLSAIPVRVAVLSGGLDPADYVLRFGAEGLQQALDSAVDALEFKWQQTVRMFGQQQPGSRRAAVESMLDFLGGLSARGGIDPVGQGLLVRRLAELLCLPAEAVFEMLRAARSRRRAAAPPERAAAESAYDSAIRGLAGGLVAAVEEYFGLVLSDPDCAGRLDARVFQAVDQCEVWRRLYGLIQQVREEDEQYTRAAVIARAEEADVCELIGRSLSRVVGRVPTAAALEAVLERMGSELDAQRMTQMRRELGRVSLSADDGSRGPDALFADLLETARGQDFVLAAERRGSSAAL
jgi:DNA primase